MTEDDDVQFQVTFKGVVKTTTRNFCIETYLKELEKHLHTIRYTCPKTDAIGEWDYTNHYSLQKMLVNGVEVEITKPCCKDDEIKIMELPDDSNEVKGGEWENIP